MVLKKYFLKQFFKYLFIINISFTLLFNFIEFFEKIVRVKHATLSMILKFIFLNIGPSFFESINLSSWLATILLLKEFAEQEEWNIFKILNINYKNLFNLFMLSGFLTATIAFVGRESISLKLQNKSENFKQEKLKQISSKKLHNKWMEIRSNTKDKNYCYFQILDQAENKGSNLILIDINKEFKIKEITSSKQFEIYPENSNIKLIKTNKINIIDNMQENFKTKIIHNPSFFSQLKLSSNIPSLTLLIKNIFLDKKHLPKSIWLNLIAELLKRLFFYLQILLYPLLTFCFFLMFEGDLRKKWISIFLPYPIMLSSDILVNFIANLNINPIFLFTPYILIIILIFFCRKRI